MPSLITTQLHVGRGGRNLPNEPFSMSEIWVNLCFLLKEPKLFGYLLLSISIHSTTILYYRSKVNLYIIIILKI